MSLSADSFLSGLALVGLLAGTSLASGLQLYAMIAVLGLLGRSGALALPPGLAILTNRWVIFTAASLSRRPAPAGADSA